MKNDENIEKAKRACVDASCLCERRDVGTVNRGTGPIRVEQGMEGKNKAQDFHSGRNPSARFP